MLSNSTHAHTRTALLLPLELLDLLLQLSILLLQLAVRFLELQGEGAMGQSSCLYRTLANKTGHYRRHEVSATNEVPSDQFWGTYKQSASSKNITIWRVLTGEHDLFLLI